MNPVAILRHHRATPVRTDVAPRVRRARAGRTKCPKRIPPSAIIIDKSAISRAGLSAILARCGYQVLTACAELDDLHPGQLAKFHASPRPALVLVGLDEVSADVSSRLRGLIDQGFRVVIVAQRFCSATVLAMLRLGAYGYLLKEEVQPALLESALTLVRLGIVVIPPGLTCSGMDRTAEIAQPADQEGILAEGTPLSEGDLKILDLLTQGASNKVIALKLDIAEATVKVRMMFLLRKLHLRNRTQAAMWATQHVARSAGGAVHQR